MRVKLSKSKGFTLIELLIVVAIIAILAAIAIPNFLAAQIRSKVSRVKANMRTVATALESYYVDNNTYPGAVPSNGGNTWGAPYVLTTPISYISTIPDDIFDVFGGAGPGFLPMKYKIAGWAYSNINASSISGTATLYINTGDGSQAQDQGPFTTREGNQTNIQYVIFSMGPGENIAHTAFNTGFWSLPSGSGTFPHPQRMWYDPTNGTVSIGYIIRDSGGNVSH